MFRSEIKQKLMEQNMMANLEVVKKEENDFVVKVPGRQELVRIEDTFAETCSHMVIKHSEREEVNSPFFPHENY